MNLTGMTKSSKLTLSHTVLLLYWQFKTKIGGVSMTSRMQHGRILHLHLFGNYSDLISPDKRMFW